MSYWVPDVRTKSAIAVLPSAGTVDLNDSVDISMPWATTKAHSGIFPTVASFEGFGLSSINLSGLGLAAVVPALAAADLAAKKRSCRHWRSETSASLWHLHMMVNKPLPHNSPLSTAFSILIQTHPILGLPITYPKLIPTLSSSKMISF